MSKNEKKPPEEFLDAAARAKAVHIPSEAGKLLGLCQFNGVVYAAFENGPYCLEDGVLKKIPFETDGQKA